MDRRRPTFKIENFSMEALSVVRDGGLSVFYESFPSPSVASHLPIVLVAGLGVQAVEAWDDNFCRQLAGTGYDVIRFDNRDSRDGNEFASGPAYSIATMAEDMKLFIDNVLGPSKSIHVVGCSMGGMIAQQFAIDYPSVTATLTSLFSSISPKAPDPEFLFKLTPLLLAPRPDTEDKFIDTRFQLSQLLNNASNHPVSKPEIVRLAKVAWSRHPAKSGTSRQNKAILHSPSRSTGLRNFGTKTLVIHGREDPMIPFSAGEETSRIIGANATELWIDEMGHFLHPDFWTSIVTAIAKHVG